MSFCEHCQGQRFDRARVLRALREVRQHMRSTRRNAQLEIAMREALRAVRALDVPHFEPLEADEDEVIH